MTSEPEVAFVVDYDLDSSFPMEIHRSLEKQELQRVVDMINRPYDHIHTRRELMSTNVGKVQVDIHVPRMAVTSSSYPSPWINSNPTNVSGIGSDVKRPRSIANDLRASVTDPLAP